MQIELSAHEELIFDQILIDAPWKCKDIPRITIGIAFTALNHYEMQRAGIRCCAGAPGEGWEGKSVHTPKVANHGNLFSPKQGPMGPMVSKVWEPTGKHWIFYIFCKSTVIAHISRVLQSFITARRIEIVFLIGSAIGQVHTPHTLDAHALGISQCRS